MTQALAAVAGVTLTALVVLGLGVRLGRWQTVLVAVMVAALIGGAR